jgi:bifunctional UDP-N-acetylglucosamine pyrophosphorylase/glucosamine-1-phosphate N-acetyltransferase
MREIGGKPMAAYLIETLERVGFLPEQMCLVVGFQKEQVESYFGDRVVYAVQEEQLGTGHAVSAARDMMWDYEHILVLYGDTPFLTEASIRSLIEAHKKRQNTLTLATLTVPHFQDSFAPFFTFGRIVRDGAGDIAADVELKDANEEQQEIRELNVGCHLFRSDWLWDRLQDLGTGNTQGEYYLTDLIGMSIGEGRKLSSVAVRAEEAVGINTPEDLQQANKKIIN